MHPVVKQLVALQKVDQRVALVQKKIDSIPRETARRRGKLEELERRRDDLKKAIDEAEAQYQDRETKVSGLDTAIKRQEGHRDEASNASSFTAAQHQIEYLHQDKENLQAEQLQLMEQIEAQTPELQKLEDEVAASAAEFAEYEAGANQLTEKLTAEREKIAEDRASFLNEIPAASMALYEDMFRQHDGQAVVASEGGYCSGCYTKLTPNDLAYLRTGATIVSCKSCGRILYLTD